MLEAESKMPADKRLDFVSVVTPNHSTIQSSAFVNAGSTLRVTRRRHTVDQAMDLMGGKGKNVIFAVTYNYTATLWSQARRMVQMASWARSARSSSSILRWLAERIEAEGQKKPSAYGSSTIR